MFSKSAKFYNAIYTGMNKDYNSEARKVHTILEKYQGTSGRRLLDVACGTGLHACALQEYYHVAGLDLDEEMLAIARQNNPGISFHQADMVNFELGTQYDAIACLFSSIGYTKTKTRMNQAVDTMVRHLLPGGVLLLEPWFTPDEWQEGSLHSLHVDQQDLKITRMNVSERSGAISFLSFHYLIGTPDGIEYFTERHELGLFTHQEYQEAFRKAGIEVKHDPEGLDGRGLYIGVKP